MKKIIALIAVLAITISILNIVAYASDTSTTMTSREYRAAQSDLIDKYANGDITFTQFQNQSQAVTNSYISKNTVDGVVAESALTVGNTMTAVTTKMANIVEQYGDDARGYVKDWWNEACNKYNVPTETTQTSTTDMFGAGAKITQLNDGYGYAYTCDYVLIRNDGSYAAVGSNNKMYYVNNGKYSYASAVGSFGAQIDDSLKFYGDVRYEDGTPAPSDDNYVYGTIKKFDDMTDKQLNDLLNEFSEELERQNPDLSNIEGLLNAIYARLGTLDSDDDNDLLSQINTSIQILNDSISDLSTSIETSINDLKETITSLLTNEEKKDDDYKTDTGTEKHEISGTLYNVIPLEKNWIQKITHDKTNLKVEYQGTVYYLEDDGTLKLGDKYYYVDMNYSSTLDEILYTLFDIRDSLDLLTEEEKQMSFDDYFDLKVSDFKLDLDEKFAFIDNIKEFLENFFNAFESSVPVYESGG